MACAPTQARPLGPVVQSLNMILKGTRQSWLATRRRIDTPHGGYGKGEWLTCGEDGEFSPTVFLVEMEPGAIAAPHFHRNNQFQIFLKGSGSIGPHPIAPYTVHYAGAYTGYGPLTAGPEGLWYFTMRPVREVGALYIEHSRDQMVRGPKRHFSSRQIVPLNPDVLAELKQPTVASLDGSPSAMPGVEVLCLPSNMAVSQTLPTNTAGHFFVVLAGALKIDGAVLETWEHIFVSNEVPLVQLEAGDSGLQMVRLSVPIKASEYVGRRT